MKRCLPLLVALVGCDRWQTCEERAEWQLEYYASQYGTQFGAGGQLIKRPDGTLLVATSRLHGAVTLGDRHFSEPHLVAIAMDGRLVDVVPAPDIADSVRHIELDGIGNLVLATTGPSVATVVGYDPALQRRWIHPLNGVYDVTALAVDASGHTILATSGSMPELNALHFLEPTGAVRWTVPLESIYVRKLWIATDGNVHAFVDRGSGLGARIRYAALDGARLDATPVAVPRMPWRFEPDGSFLAIEIYPPSVERYDAAEQLQWRRVYDEHSSVDGFDGGVLVTSSRDDAPSRTHTLLHLDAVTGETRNEAGLCDYMDIIAADDRGFVGIVAGIGIARFAFD